MPFKKGQSGNPSGRPKGKSWIKAYGQYFDDAFDKEAYAVVKQIALKSKDDRVRLKAIEMIWDRKYGKPKETMALEGEGMQSLADAFRYGMGRVNGHETQKK